MSTVRKTLAGAVLAVAALGAAAGTACADDNVDNAPHSTAPVNDLVNGDVQSLNKACGLPWHWDGPVQALEDAGSYQACQEQGGTQMDAPAIDLGEQPVTLPAKLG